MPPPTQPHDAMFKAVFSGTEHARSLLASLLPELIADLVDWSSLALLSGSYVDPGLRQSHSDLLFRARARAGPPLLLYVLVEHQSAPDAWMPQRLHAYVARIWSQWRREHAGPAFLPPVLPIVLHHGLGGWHCALSFADLYRLDPELEDVLEPYLPALRFVLYDLGTEPVEAVARRALTEVATLALLCMKLVRESADILADLARWLHLFAGALARPEGVSAVGSILPYILQTTTVPPDAVLELVEGHFGDRGREAFMLTGAQQLIERGRAEGQAELLLVQLRVRFGDVPAEAVTRVRMAAPAELETWAARILSAVTLSELFNGAP